MNYSVVNTGTSILAKPGFNIAITSALNSFTANGVAVATSATNQLYLDTSPLLVTGNVTAATVGTIFYFYDGAAALT